MKPFSPRRRRIGCRRRPSTCKQNRLSDPKFRRPFRAPERPLDAGEAPLAAGPACALAAEPEGSVAFEALSARCWLMGHFCVPPAFSCLRAIGRSTPEPSTQGAGGDGGS